MDCMKALIRRATPADAEACHSVMWTSIVDLGVRHGTPQSGSVDDWWAAGESLQRFLGDHAAEWWVAQHPENGAVIGYARSIERGGLLELAEFFVTPRRSVSGDRRSAAAQSLPTRTR